MSHRIRLLFILLLLVCGSLFAGDKIHKSPGAVKDRYIVVFENSVEVGDVAAFATELGRGHNAKVERVWTDALKGFVATMPAARAEGMSHDPRIKFIEEDAVIHLSAVVPTNVDPACDPTMATCTTTANRLWNLDRLEQDSPVLNNRYGYCSTGAGAYIYVVDTGVEATHSEFWTSESDHSNPRVLTGYNAAHAVNPTIPDNPANHPCLGFSTNFAYSYGHGTSVASVAAGRKVGVANEATIVPVLVIPCGNPDNPGTPGPPGTTAMLTEGLDWIVRVPNGSNNGNPDAYLDTTVTPNRVRLHHPAVVTLSTYRLAGDNRTGSISAFEQALDAIDAANIPVVASANNQNDDACYTTPGRHSRNNPETTLRGHVITAGGTMIKNSPMGRPVGGGVYDPTQPTVDARWVCDSNDDSNCSAGPVPAQTAFDQYYGYTKGSNYGPCVSIFVPSRNIPSASLAGERGYRTGLGGSPDYNNNGVNYLITNASGTSFSAPEVAGTIARYIAQVPNATPDDVYNTLTSTNFNGVAGMLETGTLGSGSPNLMLRLGDLRISTAPQSIGVDTNGSATLTVSATSSLPPVTYGWYRVDQPSFVSPTQAQRGWSSSTLVGTGPSITVSPTQKTSYWARAINPCSETDTNVATVSPVPTTPQFLTATPSTDGSSIRLTWNSSTNADFYYVERETSATHFDEVIGTSTTSLTVAATPNTAYVFRVRASTGDGTPRTAFSAYSNNDLAVTVPFIDPMVIAGSTAIRAQHVTELRTAVNAICDLLNIAHLYTNAQTLSTSLVGHKVSASEWSSLRNNINSLRTNPAINVGPFNFRDTLTNGIVIRKLHLDDLRSSVQ
jgi:hypothetical protein